MLTELDYMPSLGIVDAEQGDEHADDSAENGQLDDSLCLAWGGLHFISLYCYC